VRQSSASDLSACSDFRLGMPETTALFYLVCKYQRKAMLKHFAAVNMYLFILSVLGILSVTHLSISRLGN